MTRCIIPASRFCKTSLGSSPGGRVKRRLTARNPAEPSVSRYPLFDRSQIVVADLSARGHDLRAADCRQLDAGFVRYEHPGNSVSGRRPAG